MTMYSNKEKIGHFRSLRNTSTAKVDLSLLKERNSAHPKLDRYGRNPERYADDILYDLLDCCTATEITANRVKDNGGSKKSNGKGTTASKSTKPKTTKPKTTKPKTTKQKAAKAQSSEPQAKPKGDAVEQPALAPSEAAGGSAEGEDAKKK